MIWAKAGRSGLIEMTARQVVDSRCNLTCHIMTLAEHVVNCFQSVPGARRYHGQVLAWPFASSRLPLPPAARFESDAVAAVCCGYILNLPVMHTPRCGSSPAEASDEVVVCPRIKSMGPIVHLLFPLGQPVGRRRKASWALAMPKGPGPAFFRLQDDGQMQLAISLGRALHINPGNGQAREETSACPLH